MTSSSVDTNSQTRLSQSVLDPARPPSRPFSSYSLAASSRFCTYAYVSATPPATTASNAGPGLFAGQLQTSPTVRTGLMSKPPGMGVARGTMV